MYLFSDITKMSSWLEYFNFYDNEYFEDLRVKYASSLVALKASSLMLTPKVLETLQLELIYDDSEDKGEESQRLEVIHPELYKKMTEKEKKGEKDVWVWYESNVLFEIKFLKYWYCSYLLWFVE